MILKNINYFDGIYNSSLIYQFINILLNKGQKVLAELTIYNTLYYLSLKYRESPYVIFFETVESLKPNFYLKFNKKLIKKKKKIIIIPIPISYYQQYRQCLKWIKLIFLLRFKTEILSLKFLNECLNYHTKNDSILLEKKLEFYNCAINNKLNKHYRW